MPSRWSNLPLRDQLCDWGRSLSTKIEYQVSLMMASGMSSMDTAQVLQAVLETYREWLTGMIEAWDGRQDDEGGDIRQ